MTEKSIRSTFSFIKLVVVYLQFTPKAINMDQKIVSVAVFKEFLRLKKKSFGKKLIKLFLKHVLLGQWEIARTFVWIICTELSNEDKKYLSRAIFDIACNPNWQRYVYFR